MKYSLNTILKNFKFFSKKCLESLYQGIYIIQRKMMIKLEHRFKKMPSAKIDYLHYLYKNIVAKLNTIDAKVIEWKITSRILKVCRAAGVKARTRSIYIKSLKGQEKYNKRLREPEKHNRLYFEHWKFSGFWNSDMLEVKKWVRAKNLKKKNCKNHRKARRE